MSLDIVLGREDRCYRPGVRLNRFPAFVRYYFHSKHLILTISITKVYFPPRSRRPSSESYSNFVVRIQDVVSGTIVVTTKGGMSHSGLIVQVVGRVTLQLSAKTVGLFEAFYNSLKPVTVIDYTLEIQKSGKLYPFDVIWARLGRRCDL
jgi:hypothetical protein